MCSWKAVRSNSWHMFSRHHSREEPLEHPSRAGKCGDSSLPASAPLFKRITKVETRIISIGGVKSKLPARFRVV